MDYLKLFLGLVVGGIIVAVLAVVMLMGYAALLAVWGVNQLNDIGG